MSESSFLMGGGEMGRRIADHDWTGSLGPIAAWPGSLRTAVGVLLHSPIPIVLLWGEDGVMLYNDAYSASQAAVTRSSWAAGCARAGRKWPTSTTT